MEIMEIMEIMETSIDFSKYYEYNDGLLISKRTKDVAGYMREDFYVVVNLYGKNYLAHRIIWEMLKGPIPTGLVIDHIDGNPGNNRITNLRLATQSQNLSNSKSRGTLPRGVTYTKGKYQAQIVHKRKNYYLGRFNTPDEAAEAYRLKAEELHGEFSIYSNNRESL